MSQGKSTGPLLQRHSLNRPFCRYGGHIELIRFKEYYGMSRGHVHDQLKYGLSLYISREKGYQTGKPRSQCSLLPALPIGWVG